MRAENQQINIYGNALVQSSQPNCAIKSYVYMSISKTKHVHMDKQQHAMHLEYVFIFTHIVWNVWRCVCLPIRDLKCRMCNLNGRIYWKRWTNWNADKIYFKLHIVYVQIWMFWTQQAWRHDSFILIKIETESCSQFSLAFQS